jgi:hypothetical protein
MLVTNPLQGMENTDLRIEIFTLCEGAVEQNGRLSLVGTYNTLNVATFPLTIALMTVVLRLRFGPGESGSHAIRFALIDTDGNSLGADVGGTILLCPDDEDRPYNHNLIVHLQSAQFAEPGEYAIDFHLDGKLEGRLPFFMNPLDQASV